MVPEVVELKTRPSVIGGAWAQVQVCGPSEASLVSEEALKPLKAALQHWMEVDLAGELV